MIGLGISAARKRPVIWTIGHSTRPIAVFIALLKAHGIEALADIRTIPKSRHNPQFNRAALARSLARAKIGYVRMERLGGLRHAKRDSKNTGWRNASFRGYADYMATDEFSEGLKELKNIAAKKKTAVMCAEAVPWRCHRSLLADALVKSKPKWRVFHIMSQKTASPHKPTLFLRVKKRICTYPGAVLKKD